MQIPDSQEGLRRPVWWEHPPRDLGGYPHEACSVQSANASIRGATDTLSIRD